LSFFKIYTAQSVCYNICYNFTMMKSKKKNISSPSVTPMSILNESNPTYSISSKIRPIGNSKGVILPNRVIEEAGISADADLIIRVYEGVSMRV
jgi:hypothetical protein